MSLEMTSPWRFDAASDDPALGGDPFERVRYHDGMLLSAVDFTAEQRARVLRHRLHQAYLHGAGIVCGLDVVALRDSEDAATVLAVDEGLAVDELGRDLFVDRRQCLAISGLHRSEAGVFWETLERVPAREVPEAQRQGIDAESLRRVYVVLRYQAHLTAPIPALSPACGPLEDQVVMSRIQDGFCIELEAERPAPPLSRPPLEPAATMAQALREAIGRCEGVARAWTPMGQAPLALACVVVGQRSVDGAVEVVAIEHEVRASLMSVQRLAEALYGPGVSGAEPAPSLRILRVELLAQDAAPTIAITLSRAPRRGTARDAVGLAVLKPDDEAAWQAVDPEMIAVELADEVTLLVHYKGEGLEEGTLLQLTLSGHSSAPLVDRDGYPLSGMWHQPQLAPGQGRDVSHIVRWPPKQETPR